MTITLVQYRRGMGVPNLSPFCMKAEVLLKMSGKAYEIELLDDPRKTPKGKLPMIRDGAHTIADSAVIQAYLEDTYGADFYPGISDKDRAVGHACARMCEERTYWALVYARWIEPENWPKIKEFWFGGMPFILRSIIPKIAIKEVKANLRAHGLGRHCREEIYAFARRDIDTIAALLGRQDFLLGNTPTGVDATVYPIIENALIEALPSPVLQAAKAHDTLLAYAQRCRSLWFADL